MRIRSPVYSMIFRPEGILRAAKTPQPWMGERATRRGKKAQSLSMEGMRRFDWRKDILQVMAGLPNRP